MLTFILCIPLLVLSHLMLTAAITAGLSGGQFDEVEGESEERRRARLGRHCRTNDRMVCFFLYVILNSVFLLEGD